MIPSSEPSERRADLLRRLQAHPPADADEREHQRRLIDLVGTAADPFSRGHFTPGHVTASAFVLAPEGGLALLIHHGKLHRWLQPGGHVEPGDRDIEQAARREVAEETGVAVDAAAAALFDLDIHLIPARLDEPAHEHFDVRLLLHATSRRLDPGAEVKGARWVPFDEVAGLETDRSVLRAIDKLRRRP